VLKASTAISIQTAGPFIGKCRSLHMHTRKTVRDAALSCPFTRNDIVDLASSDADSHHH